MSPRAAVDADHLEPVAREAAAPARTTPCPTGDRAARPARLPHTGPAAGENAAPTGPAALRPPPPSAAACDSAPAPLQIATTKTFHNTLARRIAPLQNGKRTWRTAHPIQKRTTDVSPTQN